MSNYNKQNKTEFLFESDMEKVVLKEAEKNLKKKHKKHVFYRTISILLIFVLTFASFIYIKEMKIKKLKAESILLDKKAPNEKKFNSSNMKKYMSNYKDKYTILVNKKNTINKSYLVNYNIITVVDNKYKDILLEEETYANYIKFKKDLSNKGYEVNITSGFENCDDTISSEHHTGLAFDIKVNNSSKEAYKYVENIAYLYGFIVRYPKGKEQITGYKYEPTHLRYVGYSLAKYLKRNNMTLEEYYKAEN